MNKEQLISAILGKIGCTKKESQCFLDAFIDVVTKSLAGNDNVQLAGLGSLVAKKRKATTGRNPRTGDAIQISEKNVVKFSPAKKLKEAVNN